MHKVERLTATIGVAQYIDEYVNIDEFLECCKACPNYNRKWSCPPHDFDVINYWQQFNKLYLISSKITLTEESKVRNYDNEELIKVLHEALLAEKLKLIEELFAMEKVYPGSMSLFAGSCGLCGDGLMDNGTCSRIECNYELGGAKAYCRHFDKMRYSLESLGGNVGATCSQLLGTELKWVEAGKLPPYFVLVAGLLTKDNY